MTDTEIAVTCYLYFGLIASNAVLLFTRSVSKVSFLSCLFHPLIFFWLYPLVIALLVINAVVDSIKYLWRL